MSKNVLFVLGLLALVGCTEPYQHSPELPIGFRGDWVTGCSATVEGSYSRTYQVQSNLIDITTQKYDNHTCQGSTVETTKTRQVLNSVFVKNEKEVVAQWVENDKHYRGPISIESGNLQISVAISNGVALAQNSTLQLYRNKAKALAAQKAASSAETPKALQGEWQSCENHKGRYVVVGKQYIQFFRTSFAEENCSGELVDYKLEELLSTAEFGFKASETSFEGPFFSQENPSDTYFVGASLQEVDEGQEFLVVTKDGQDPHYFRKAFEKDNKDGFWNAIKDMKGGSYKKGGLWDSLVSWIYKRGLAPLTF